MKTKTYYGEYTLRKWIELILSKNIVLPEYQRYFVWNEEKVEKLIESLKNDDYIPPITIGAFKIKGKEENYIIDGQQRLTSIFLVYLGYFPDREKCKKNKKSFIAENDENNENEYDNVIEWRFSDLIKDTSDIESIKKHMSENTYKSLNFGLNDEILNKYMKFLYIVCDSNDETSQNNFFAKTFRNINFQGVGLQPEESREALYSIDSQKEPLFLFKDIHKIKEQKIDSLRYLAFLFDYAENPTATILAYSYGKNMETYYEEFLYSVINNEKHRRFKKFDDVFKNNDFNQELKNLNEIINSLDYDFSKQSSIIEYDFFYFGLIYTVLFEKKIIDLTRKTELFAVIKSAVESFKKENKNNYTLTRVTERLKKSVEIYRNYEI